MLNGDVNVQQIDNDCEMHPSLTNVHLSFCCEHAGKISLAIQWQVTGVATLAECNQYKAVPGHDKIQLAIQAPLVINKNTCNMCHRLRKDLLSVKRYMYIYIRQKWNMSYQQNNPSLWYQTATGDNWKFFIATFIGTLQMVNTMYILALFSVYLGRTYVIYVTVQ